MSQTHLHSLSMVQWTLRDLLYAGAVGVHEKAEVPERVFGQGSADAGVATTKSGKVRPLGFYFQKVWTVLAFKELDTGHRLPFYGGGALSSGRRAGLACLECNTARRCRGRI